MRASTNKGLRAVWVAISLIVALCPRDASATDRFYADIRTTSENGRFVLEAKSPDNARSGYKAFQSNFVYTLTDTATSRAVWNRTQPEREAPPKGAWVYNNGDVVVWNAKDDLMLFAPESPDPTGVVNILDQFSEDEHNLHVHQTTAGRQWDESSRWYFVEHQEHTYFVVRAWWGRRVVVEPRTGGLAGDVPGLQEAVVATERAQTLRILEDASRLAGVKIDQRTGHADDRYAYNVIAAARLAGRDGLKEAIPFLLEIEKWNYIGSSSTVAIWFDNPLPEGSVDPLSWSEYSVRLAAQTALRRLGHPPGGLPGTQFWFEAKDYDDRKPVPVTLARPRLERVDAIAIGMKPIDVIELIGAPDAISTRGHGWEYDMDSEDPFTLRIDWTTENPPTVSGIDRITPPQWMVDGVRDEK